MTNFQRMAHRLDSVRALLERDDLKPWARNYWTTVERQLTTNWARMGMHSTIGN
jgi:hypothetical protein